MEDQSNLEQRRIIGYSRFYSPTKYIHAENTFYATIGMIRIEANF
jgi:hypothetical protein